jgi:L-threonylcarbamoyladenylate synthase
LEFMPQVSLEQFVAAICSGQQLGSFPTDTVPALASRPDRAELIFEAKQRSLDKPLILMAATVEDLWEYVQGSATERQIWQQTAERYLPGALTLVLPASDRVPTAMNPKDPTTLGVRVPDHAIAQAILAQTGPLATTSANFSGQPALQTMAEIETQFPQVLTLPPTVLESLQPSISRDRPLQPSGVPSTVARWTGENWEILRQGAVSLTGYTLGG